jgi:hypothetical protein
LNPENNEQGESIRCLNIPQCFPATVRNEIRRSQSFRVAIELKGSRASASTPIKTASSKASLNNQNLPFQLNPENNEQGESIRCLNIPQCFPATVRNEIRRSQSFRVAIELKGSRASASTPIKTASSKASLNNQNISFQLNPENNEQGESIRCLNNSPMLPRILFNEGKFKKNNHQALI